MENVHRQLIIYHLDTLVSSTNYDLMKKKLLSHQVLTQVMIENIESDIKDQNEVKLLNAVYRKLVHRGPTAFSKLLEIFKECDYKRAYNILSQSTVPAQSYSNIPVVTEDNRFLSISSTAGLYRQNSNSNSCANNKEMNTKNNNLIKNHTDGSFQSKSNTIKLEPYTVATSFNIENLEVKKAADYGKHSLLPVYSMRSRRRGVLFFVNIINFQEGKSREGAIRDHDNLVTLFRELGFTIFYYEDLKRAELLKLLRELAHSEYLNDIDSFFCCIQTHGDLLNGHTIMEFSDGEHEYTDKIVAQFSNIDCRALINKPKVFFFPFCRGKISDKLKNVHLTRSSTETDGVGKLNLVPTFSDILICYGTVPGFTTHRDTSFGSWYVRELCKVFAEHACNHHIEDLLKLVAMNIMRYDHGLVQVASTENRGFNSLLFLNPKISDA